MVNKHTANILFVLLITSLIYSQEKDFRAELNIQGTVKELSVSPNNSIWFATAVGNTYYTKDIYSIWHDGSLSFYKENDYLSDYPHFDRVTFFNKDIAIITGYVPSDTERREKNGLFRTEDGGRHWNILNFGDDTWVYCVFTNTNGHAWLGGSSGNLSYSNDFGKTWIMLNPPFENKSRIHQIFMKNNYEGIAGALENKICYTTDNWKSRTRIQTPFDQKLYISYSSFDDNRIEKIFYWKDYIVVYQGREAFYTNTNNISWQRFPLKILDLDIDPKSKDLWAVTNDLHVVKFRTPSKYTKINLDSFSKIPSCISVINSSLFAYSLLENKIYKVNENEFYSTYLFTTDHKIKKPELTRKYGDAIWGINGQHLYISKNKGASWSREYIFPVSIFDLKLINSKTAVLWDGKKKYSYTIGNRTHEVYNLQTPINSFLRFPITKLSVEECSEGCFHSLSNKIAYITTSDSAINLNEFTSRNGLKTIDVSKIPERLKKQINISELYKILNAINANPSRVPLINEFHITNTDKAEYRKLCERISVRDKAIMMGIKYDNTFYENLAQNVDTLSLNSISEVLNTEEGILSTSSNTIEVTLVNSNKDTLKFSRKYYDNSNGWHLPWTVCYNGLFFRCYNLDFSRYIRTLLPDDFHTSKFFQNSYFILWTANYFYRNYIKRELKDLNEERQGIFPEWLYSYKIILIICITLILLGTGVYIYKKYGRKI